MSLLLLLTFSFLLVLVSSAALASFGFVVLVPHVAVLMIVYASIRQGAFSGLMHALVLGLLLGLFAGAGRGAQLLAFLPLIPLSVAARRSFQANTPGLMALTCIPAVLLADLVLALMLSVFHPAGFVLPTLLRVTPASALVSGVVAYPLFLLLEFLRPLSRSAQGTKLA